MHPSPRPRSSLRLQLVLAALLLTPLLAACGEEGSDLMVEMAVEWASEKNLITCTGGDVDLNNCEPSLNYGEIGLYAIGYGTDPNVQAAFDTGLVVADIQQADQLAAEGLAAGDVSKLDEAIALRPNDWAYHEQRAALQLSLNGDITAFNTAALASEQLAVDHITNTLQAEGLSRSDPRGRQVCDQTYYNLYRQRESALLAQLDQESEPANAAQLITQIDLVRLDLQRLDDGSGNSPCK